MRIKENEQHKSKRRSQEQSGAAHREGGGPPQPATCAFARQPPTRGVWFHAHTPAGLAPVVLTAARGASPADAQAKRALFCRATTRAQERRREASQQS